MPKDQEAIERYKARQRLYQFRAKARSLSAEGLSTAEIAKKLQASTAEVRSALASAPKPQASTAKRNREILRARTKGETLAVIGERFGLSVVRVRQIAIAEARRVRQK